MERKEIVAYIQKIGRQASEVSTINLTHYHMDHVGSTKELKDLAKTKVTAHVKDSDFIAEKKPFSKPQNIRQKQNSP